MWKRPVLRIDILCISIVIVLIMCVGIELTEHLTIQAALSIAIIIVTIWLCVTQIQKNKLPGGSKYNWYNAKKSIEFHIGNKCKGDYRKIGIYLKDTINIAKEKKLDIVFSTWLFKKETVESIFQSAAVVYTPSPLDKLVGRINKKIYRHRKKQNDNPLINVYIYADKVDEEMIEKIKHHFRISDK